MAKREELEATLAKAEAALAKAETIASNIDEKRSKVIDNLGKARAHCHQAYVALAKHKRSEPTA